MFYTLTDIALFIIILFLPLLFLYRSIISFSLGEKENTPPWELPYDKFTGYMAVLLRTKGPESQDVLKILDRVKDNPTRTCIAESCIEFYKIYYTKHKAPPS